MLGGYSGRMVTVTLHDPKRIAKEMATNSVKEILANGFNSAVVEVDGVRVEGTRVPGGLINLIVKDAGSEGTYPGQKTDLSFIDVFRAFSELRSRAYRSRLARAEWSLKVDITNSSIHIIHKGLKDMATIMFESNSRNGTMFYSSTGADITDVACVKLYKTGCISPDFRAIRSIDVGIDTRLDDFDWRDAFGPLGEEMHEFFTAELNAALNSKS